MCDEISTPVGTSAGANLDLLASFVARNAIPCAVAVVADVALVFLIAHIVLVIACTSVLLVGATVGRVALARWLCHVLGRHVAPVGLDKLRPPKPARVKRAPVPALPRAMQRTLEGRVVPAIEARGPLAIEAAWPASASALADAVADVQAHAAVATARRSS